MPKDRGIMFSAPMVHALIAGRKTQTRRMATSPLAKCEPGDRLWVRETHAYVGSTDPGWLVYRATYDDCCARHGFDQPYPPESAVRWTPSLLMRRAASRLKRLTRQAQMTGKIGQRARYRLRREGLMPPADQIDQSNAL